MIIFIVFSVITGVYKGCFTDSGNRAMPHGFFSNSGMTINMCVQHCSDLGYPYAGLEWYAECFCGDETYGSQGERSDDECNTACKGNSEEMCGGGWRLSVYATGKRNI